MEELVSATPDDARARETLCYVLIYTTRNHLRAGDADQALTASEDALRIVRRLEENASANAANPELRSEVLLLQGGALTMRGDLAVARAALDESMQITERLLATDPERGVFLRQQAATFEALGDLERRRAQGMEAGAAEAGDQRAGDTDTRGAWREALVWYERAQGVYDGMEARGRLCGVEAERLSRLGRAQEEARRATTDSS